jgi:hypothetical protein
MPVYFAQTPTGSIKIGCTGDIETRLKPLGSEFGVPWSLLTTRPGDCVHFHFVSSVFSCPPRRDLRFLRILDAASPAD